MRKSQGPFVRYSLYLSTQWGLLFTLHSLSAQVETTTSKPAASLTDICTRPRHFTLLMNENLPRAIRTQHHPKRLLQHRNIRNRIQMPTQQMLCRSPNGFIP